MNRDKSYIDIEASMAMKGFLIVLIVLGHNMLFTYYVEPIRGMDYIYSFHIQAFFLLPFLYGVKRLTKKRILTYVVRLYWPYFLLTGILCIGYYFFYLNGKLDWGIFQMWLTGDSILIKQYCGVQIFWFMPAMFSMSILKDLFYYSGRFIRFLLLFFSVIFNVLLLLAPLNIHFFLLSSSLSSILPFGIYLGSSFLCWGVLSRWIIGKLEDTDSTRVKIWICSAFVLSTILFFINSIILDEPVVFITVKIVMPVIFIILLWAYRSYFSKTAIWRKMGTYSFSIYLIHPFIGYMLYAIFIKSGFQLSSTWALLALLIMVGTSYVFSIVIYKVEKFRILLFPRSLSELKSLIGYEKRI